MQSYDGQSLVARRLEVGLRVPDLEMSALCHTNGIGADGVSIDGAPPLHCGQLVELTFDDKHGRTLSVDCVVEPHVGSRVRLRYRDLHQERRERLEQIIWPSWDGSNLLDGLVLMADRYGAASLKDWLRLTSLLAAIQPRMACRQRSLA